MLGGEVVSRTAWLVVDDEIDATLPPKIDIFGAVMGHQCETTSSQYGLNDALLPRRELDELESVETQWIVEQVAHCAPPGPTNSGLPADRLRRRDEEFRSLTRHWADLVKQNSN